MEQVTTKTENGYTWYRGSRAGWFRFDSKGGKVYQSSQRASQRSALRYYWTHRAEILRRYRENPNIRQKSVEYLRQKRRSDEAYRKHHTELVVQSIRKRAHELRAEIIKRLGGKCQSCGFSNPLALELHKEKEMPRHTAYTKMGKYGYYRMLLKEIDDVKLLCANCHRILHYKDKNWGKNKE